MTPPAARRGGGAGALRVDRGPVRGGNHQGRHVGRRAERHRDLREPHEQGDAHRELDHLARVEVSEEVVALGVGEVVRVGQELEVSHPELSQELLLINFEQRAGVQRNAAWQSFAVRANFESARSFVAMLIQTDRFGTPIAKSLGAFSDALRTQRRQKAEEKAAKTTIKLVPPLVFCIFPAMGAVVIGPALVAISYFFSHFLHA